MRPTQAQTAAACAQVKKREEFWEERDRKRKQERPGDSEREEGEGCGMETARHSVWGGEHQYSL